MSIIKSNRNLKKVFISMLFLVLILPLSQSFACDAPVERFCVDFFKGTNLQGKVLATRKAPFIRYNWKSYSPVDKLPYNNFSARWRGEFDFNDGPYDFRVLADDGVRILIDGTPVIDHWQDKAGAEFIEQITPGAGTHLVEVEYFEATGNAKLEVDWKMATVTTDDNSTDINASALKTASKKVTNVNQKQAAIGVNLSPFSYYSSTIPFKDLMMQSGGLKVLKQNSNDSCAEQPTLDQEGYPQTLSSNCLIRIWTVFHILGDEFWPAGTPPYQSGHYVLLYQGRGKIRLGWDAKNVVYKSDGRIEFDVATPKDGIQIEITSMEWGAPIRDMHILHINDEASYKTQPFNAQWLKLLKPFKVLRFMDWGAVSVNTSVYYGQAVSHTAQTITLPTSAPAEDSAFANMVALVSLDNKWPRVFIDRYDGATRTLYLKTPIEPSISGNQPTVNIFNFLNKSWADRAPPTTLGQGSQKGVAFESMIKLANVLGVDPWITIPTAADNDFVKELALLLKKSLNPNLKVYIEYSNETWNFGFPGYNYSEAKARELQLSGAAVQADAWQAYRAVEIFKIFNRVYSEADLRTARTKSRLVRVLTSQTAWFDRAKSVMDWKMPNNGWPTLGNPAYAFADAWAVTTYFYLDKDHPIETLSTNELMTAQVDSINQLFGDSKNPGLIRNILAESKARGLQLVAYEGGTHVLAPQNSQEMNAKAALLNKDPQMKDVYSVLLNQWNSLYKEFGAGSVGVMNHYSDISRYAKYGYWGLMQSTYQDPASAPKYQAITDYVPAP